MLIIIYIIHIDRKTLSKNILEILKLFSSRWIHKFFWTSLYIAMKTPSSLLKVILSFTYCTYIWVFLNFELSNFYIWFIQRHFQPWGIKGICSWWIKSGEHMPLSKEYVSASDFKKRLLWRVEANSHPLIIIRYSAPSPQLLSFILKFLILFFLILQFNQ